MKKKLFLVLVASLLVTGCVKTPKLENGEEVVASLDGKQISANELYEELKGTYGSNALINMVDKYIVSKELSDTKTEAAQAKSYIAQMKNYYENSGYNWSDVLSSNGYTEQTLIDSYTFNYAKETIANNYYKNNVTEKEINKYYKDEIIGDITAKQILIVPETNKDMTDEEKETAKVNAYNKALEVISKLNEGADFSELAKQYSDDDSKENGGTLAPFNKQSNYPTKFIENAVSLEVGKYSAKPIESEYGYHILYIVSKADKPELESVKDTIVTLIAKEKTEANSNYVETAWKAIREKYNLSIFDTNVDEKYKSSVSKY